MSEEQAVKEEKDTEVLEPDYSVRYQVIGKDEHIHTFAQRPLSFFGKIELFSLLGGTIDEAMKEGDISVADFFPGDRSLEEADTFIQAIARLVEIAPDFLKDLYCIALGVPKGERQYIKALMEAPSEDGGLSDEDGIDILDTFVEQNWEAMQDFFFQKVTPLFQKVSSKAQGTASSKPSKATPRRTRKQ